MIPQVIREFGKGFMASLPAKQACLSHETFPELANMPVRST